MSNLPKDIRALEEAGYKVVQLDDGRIFIEGNAGGDEEPTTDPICYNDDVVIEETTHEEHATVAEFLDAAIYNSDFTSDRDLARYMGVSHASLNNWRRGITFPTDVHMEKLCEFAGCDLWYGLLILNYWKTKSKRNRRVYRRIIDGLITLTSQHGISDFDDYVTNARNGLIKKAKAGAAGLLAVAFIGIAPPETKARTSSHGDLTTYTLSVLDNCAWTLPPYISRT